MADGLDFRVLGPLEIAAGERVLELGGGKQQALLATLLLRAGEGRIEARDTEPERAAAELRSAPALWRGPPLADSACETSALGGARARAAS